MRQLNRAVSAFKKETRLPQRSYFLLMAIAAFPFLDFPLFWGSSYTRPLAYLIILPCCVIFAFPLIFSFLNDVRHLASLKVYIGFVTYSLLISLAWAFVQQSGGEIAIDWAQLGSLGVGVLGLVFFLYFLNNAKVFRLCCVVTGMVSIPLVILCCLQWWAMHQGQFGSAVTAIAGLFNYRASLENGKAFGLAPEGSYLADYIAIAVMPVSWAWVCTGESLFKKRWLGIVPEIWMLVGGGVCILAAQSRIGLIYLAFQVLLTLFLAQGGRRKLISNIAVIVFIGTIAAGIGYEIEYGGENYFHDLIVNPSNWQSENEVSNTTRAACMVTGIRIGTNYPLGVGIGRYGVYFRRFVPTWALWDPEIRNYLGALNEFGTTSAQANSKGMFSRLFAEVGFPGLILFAVWLLYVGKESYTTVVRTKNARNHNLAIVIMISFGTIIVAYFNTDSFILPYHYYIIAAAVKAKQIVSN